MEQKYWNMIIGIVLVAGIVGVFAFDLNPTWLFVPMMLACHLGHKH